MKEVIRIALCDDNEQDLLRVQDRIQKIMKEWYPEEKHEIIPFHSPIDLEFEIQQSDVADVFILDVEMPEINGFQIAKKIQDHNASAVVFFFTAHMEMANKGYMVRAIRYINKMAADTELRNALSVAIHVTRARRHQYIIVEYDRTARRILLDRIEYATIEDKKMMIYLQGESEPVRDRRGIKELQQVLNHERFILINRGTIVNADYVDRIDDGYLEMVSGKILSISRRMMKDVKQSIMSFWSSHT